MTYARNRPPKNMISVTRKTHIPRVAASRCWTGESKWCACTAVPACDAAAAVEAASARMGRLLRLRVFVRAAGDHRRGREVLGRRRRGGLPLQADDAPRVRGGVRPVAHRPDEVDERNEV